MTGFLTPQTVCAVFAVALIFCVLPGLSAAIRALKTPPAPDAGSGPFVSGLSGFCLMYFVALSAFLPALAVIGFTARLMGFGPNVFGTLPNANLLFWTLVAPYLWFQSRYIMGLRRFWMRCRYLGMLVVLPLFVLALAWLVLDAARAHGVVDNDALAIANQWASLLSIGILPYGMPAIHKHLLAPVFTWMGTLAPDPQRGIVIAIGNVLFAITLVGLFVFFCFVLRTTYARLEGIGTRTHAGFSNVGFPHNCLGYYPAISLQRHEMGTTTLAFHITTAGSVKDVSVVRSSGHDRLDQAAMTCVTSWRYKPAVKNGQSAEVPWKVQIVWNLQ